MKNFILFMSLISINVLYAQVTTMDTLSMKGLYIIKCACTKNKMAIVDLLSIHDTTIIRRLYFDYTPNKDMSTIKTNDTVFLDMQIPYIMYFYHTRYLTFNQDSLALVIYQPHYRNKIGRAIKVNDGLKSYYIAKRCPRSIIRRSHRFFWRYFF